MVDRNVQPHDSLLRKRCLFERLDCRSILDATEKGLDGLQNLDPFHDIDPLATSDSLEVVDGNESETK